MSRAPESYCFLVNESSNSGKTKAFIKDRESCIRKIIKGATFRYIKEHESISAIAEAESLQNDVVVACGGDGTVRNTAIGLLKTDCLLGVIPCGSGNDFARMLGLTNDFERNLLILKNAERRSVDVILCNQSCFLNTYGIGFDGLTNHYASKSSLLKGRFKYIFAGLKSLLHFKNFEYSITVEGDLRLSGKTPMIVFANGKWEGGGFFVSPLSNHSDQILEMVIVKPAGRIRLAALFLKLSSGKPIPENYITSYKGSDYHLKSSVPVYSHADGEIVEPVSEFDIKVHPETISVLN